MTNIEMKVNFKLGGTNTMVEELKDFSKDTLILGADVVHPITAAFEGCPFNASIVGSVEDSATRYFGSMRLQSKQKTDRKIIDDVKDMVLERLRDWNSTSSPPNIVYF